MPIQEFAYHGRKIVINTEGDKLKVKIDDEDIPILHSKDSGRFVATKHYGFKPYNSLVDLAKEVIDHVINQRRS